MRQLSACTEEEREEAMGKYEKIRKYLEGEKSQEELAKEGGVSVRTIQRWVKEYREAGLRGLVKGERKDRGTRREMSEEEVKVVEGLALRNSGRSVATVYREWLSIAKEQGWKEQSYRTICRIVQEIGGAEMTMGNFGESVYREEYDLVCRRSARRPNDLWQADHMLLDIWLVNEKGKMRRPWLTVILDDYSRAVAGYRIGWDAPNSLQTALTLRQAGKTPDGTSVGYQGVSTLTMDQILPADIWSKWEWI